MHNELIINLFEMIFFLSRIRMQMFVRGHVFPKGVETKVRRDNLPCTRIIIAMGDDIASIRLAVEPPRPVTRIGQTERERGTRFRNLDRNLEENCSCGTRESS